MLRPVSKAPSLTFFGAAGEVTGSCTLVQTDSARVLVDFGLFQGSPAQEERNLIPPALDFRRLDAVVCTHAHVDHCGRLGMLPGLEYEGYVFCHQATAELLPRVLNSSATLQGVRLEEYRKGTAPEAVVLDPVPDPAILEWQRRTGPPPVLYQRGQAEKVGRSVVGVPYGVWKEIAPGVRMRLHDAGHIIGSASVELEIQHQAHHVRVVFSGDLGSTHSGLLAPRAMCPEADAVIMESTTGARSLVPAQPGSGADAGAPGSALPLAAQGGGGLVPVISLEQLVADARASNRMVVLPTFSVGRAQLLVHQLAQLSRAGKLGGMPVYLDSPMAARTAEVCCMHPHLLSAAARADLESGHSPLDFDELFLLWSRKHSLRVAGRQSAGLVLAGSGFCDAGPVLHHLQQALPEDNGHVVFSGHTLLGSLAHGLAHGRAKRVRINGMEIQVRARVSRMEGFSGHADPAQLEAWLVGSGHQPDLVVLNHGDPGARGALAERVGGHFHATVQTPAFQETLLLD